MSHRNCLNTSPIISVVSTCVLALGIVGCEIEKEESALDEPIPIDLNDPCLLFSCDELHRGVCVAVGEEAECHCEEGYVEDDDGSCLWPDDDATLTIELSQGCPGYVMASEGPVEIHCGEQCTATAPVGTVVRLEAYPTEECMFDRWENCSSFDGGSCMVNLDGDTTVVAHFANSSLGEANVVTPLHKVSVNEPVPFWVRAWEGGPMGEYVAFTCVYDQTTSIEWTVSDFSTGEVVATAYDVGDPVIPCVDETDPSVSFEHTFETPGGYDVHARIYDETGGWFEGSATVVVE